MKPPSLSRKSSRSPNRRFAARVPPLARLPRTLPLQAGGALDEGFLAASSYHRSHLTFRRLRIARRNRSRLGRQSHYRQDDSQYGRSEEHTSELQSLAYLVCRLLLEKKK